MNTCKHCNKPTSNPKFCSRSCSSTHTNRFPKRVAKKRFCETCQIETPARRRFCDVCRPNSGIDMTLKEATYSDYVGGYRAAAFAKVRWRARAIYLTTGKKSCEKCGYSKHIEVCHIRPIADYPPDTLLSVINDTSNLIGLCPNCHWEFDHQQSSAPART